MRSENIDNSEESRVLRQYYEELDDEALDLLRQYFKIEKSDDNKFLRVVKRNRVLNYDQLENNREK